MSVKVGRIIHQLQKFAPEYLAESWDKIGLQIGSINNDVSKVLLALDATSKVIDEAINQKVEMIITHHPFLFNSIDSITKDTPIGYNIYKLIENNISIYTMHTNLDATFGGTNDVLAKKLNLTHIEALVPSNQDGLNSTNLQDKKGIYGLGRVGTIEKTTVEQLAYQLKKALGTEAVRVVGDLKQKVNKVALCTGSGMSLLNHVIGKADLYITGDVKFHEAQKGIDYNVGIIDVGHYASENIVLPTIKKYMGDFATEHGVEFIVSNVNDEPFKTI